MRGRLFYYYQPRGLCTVAFWWCIHIPVDVAVLMMWVAHRDSLSTDRHNRNIVIKIGAPLRASVWQQHVYLDGSNSYHTIISSSLPGGTD